MSGPQLLCHPWITSDYQQQEHRLCGTTQPTTITGVETGMRVRPASWIIAGIFLVAFCFLGLIAEKFALIFEGMNIPMPVMAKLFSVQGMIVGPTLGFLAAASLILTDKLRSGPGKWAQPALIIVYAFLGAYIFLTFMSCFSTITTVALNP